MTATQAVLNTPELLEMILLQLDLDTRKGLKTLLLGQRVCKSWQAVIAGSSKLQQALFFRSVPAWETPVNAHNNKIHHYNPFVIGSGGAIMPGFRHCGTEIDVYVPQAMLDFIYVHVSLPRGTSITEFLAHTTGSSWQRMQVRQPSTAVRIRIKTYENKNVTRWSPREDVKGHSGETLGHLLGRLSKGHGR